MFNGVLVAFLVDNQIFKWSPVEIGWLLAIPVLSGSIFRLHGGIWTDKYGGKWMMGGLLFLCAIPMYFVSYANSFAAFALCSFGFGIAGVGFSIGIAYTSLWYPKEWQCVSAYLAWEFSVPELHPSPNIIKKSYRQLEQILKAGRTPNLFVALIIMGFILLLFTKNKISESR